MYICMYACVRRIVHVCVYLCMYVNIPVSASNLCCLCINVKVILYTSDQRKLEGNISHPPSQEGIIMILPSQEGIIMILPRKVFFQLTVLRHREKALCVKT